MLKDPEKFGKTVGAARGSMNPPYDKKVNFAKLIGKSLPTLRRIEEGNVGSIGVTVEERRQLAERIVEQSGALPDWFGLNELVPGEADQLRTLLSEQARAQTKLSEELSSVRRSQGEMLKRLEQLERGPEEATN